MGERLHKYLARAGIASRRAAERLVMAGRVRVNGVVVQQLGTSVDPGHDKVQVDGRDVEASSERLFIALHKPRGVVSTAMDPQGRTRVVDLVDVARRVYPVGRLDIDSEGLIILTDDGDMTLLLTHPRHAVAKEYRVLVRGGLAADGLEALRGGVVLDGRRTAPVDVQVEGRQGNRASLRIVLHEGRNRQIRRMIAAVGGEVIRLIRTRIGPIELADLGPGEWRLLTSSEVAALRGAGQ